MITELIKQAIDVVNLWVQGALAVGTWALVGISLHFMRKSANQIAESNKINKEANDLAKAELKSRLRPEIVLQDVKSTLETGPVYVMRVIGRIKNTGTVPASNIRTYFAETSKGYLWELVKDREEIIRKSQFFASLAPRDENEFLFQIDWAKDKAQTKLAIWAEYDYEDIAPEKGEKIFLCTVTGGGSVTLIQFGKSDIERVRMEIARGIHGP